MSPQLRAATAIALAAMWSAACTTTIDYGPRQTTLPPTGATLPARFARGVFLLQVELPGHRDRQFMLLDTGTDRTLLDLAAVRVLGLHAEGTETVVTATGAAVPATRLQRLPWLRIGGVQFFDIDAIGLDLSALREHGGLPIVGIAGCDLFRQCLVELDYPARAARVLPQSSAPSSGGHRFAERSPWVTLDVAGTSIRALVDSGFQQAIALPPGTALPWLRAPASDGDLAAIDGIAAKSIARLRGSVRLGDLEWQDPAVVLVPGTPKIGTGLLRRCVVLLDAAAGRIWIEPGHSARSR